MPLPSSLRLADSVLLPPSHAVASSSGSLRSLSDSVDVCFPLPVPPSSDFGSDFDYVYAVDSDYCSDFDCVCAVDSDSYSDDACSYDDFPLTVLDCRCL